MVSRQKRILFIAILILFSTFYSYAEQQSILRVTFLDVGQGDAIVIRTNEKTILLDAGDDRANAANAVIIPYCKKEGIKKFDSCIISHPHRDHFGGYLDLLQAVSIGEFVYSSDNSSVGDAEESSGDDILYNKMKDMIIAKGIPYNKAVLGQKFDWGKNVKVELFHAEEAARRASDALKISANEHSLIIKATLGQISYLFTGDAEKGAESKAIADFKEKLNCTVLKAGHHGSKTSSGYPFMDITKPEYGIISVGAHNSFGHPNKETLDKYAFYKMKVFRTDQDGIVDSYTDGKTIHFTSNQSALEFTQPPQVISMTANSATIQWVTNKPANTKVKYGVEDLSFVKDIDNAVTIHTVTLTGLKPKTTYKFQVSSQDIRQPDQVVSSDGSITTPPGNGKPLPKISTMLTNFAKIYMKKPFQVNVTVVNPDTEPVGDISVILYHTAMADENMLGQQTFSQIPASGQITPEFPAEISWQGKIELIAVLLKGKTIIDTSSINIDVEPKLFLVDCAHGNIDYYTGKFAGMKMDLYQNLGYTVKSISKPFTAEILKDAFIVAIPDCKQAFEAPELAALKEFSTNGGSLLLFSRSDYKNYSNPAVLNEVLKSIGSTIRFNDDEVGDPTNNIGYPWGAWIRIFPSDVVQGVTTLLIRNCCSLINSKETGLTASKNLKLFAVGDDDAFNIDGDGKSDAWIYASHTPKLPIPIAAGEDLGNGKVACFGESFYDDKLYAPNNQIQTPQFNRCVVSWLGAAKDKDLRELLSYVAELDLIDDAEARAMRFEGLKSRISVSVNEYLVQGQAVLIKDAFTGFQGKAIEDIKIQVREAIQFKVLHGELPSESTSILEDL